MQTLLSKVKPSDVRLDPFPHVVIRDALPSEFISQLLEEYPTIDVITKKAPYVSNQRFSYSASHVLGTGTVSPVWEQIVKDHTSKLFWEQIVGLFGKEVIKLAPWLAPDTNLLKEVKLGIRNVDTYKEKDVLLEAQICLNTPVVDQPTSVKISHLDNAHELFAGLLYLRPAYDDSKGGALELYKYKNVDNIYFHGPRLIDNRYVQQFDSIEYENNVFVLFINTFYALHGVTSRMPTKYPRYLFNVLGEVERPLFDLKPYKEGTFRKVLRHLPF